MTTAQIRKINNHYWLDKKSISGYFASESKIAAIAMTKAMTKPPTIKRLP